MTADSTALRLVVAMSDEPSVHDLWTVNRLACLPCRFGVVTVARADQRPIASLGGRARRLGFGRAVSSLIGAHVVGRARRRRERRQMESLFDGRYLRQWWRTEGLDRTSASDAQRARAAIANLRPDIVVLASDGVIGDVGRSLAGPATIAIHHGTVPRIRRPWSIPRGIIDGRPDWIGATVYEVTGATGSGRVLWRGSPQAACGDTAVTLLFRAHVEAVEALAGLIREWAAGKALTTVACEPEATDGRPSCCTPR